MARSSLGIRWPAAVLAMVITGACGSFHSTDELLHAAALTQPTATAAAPPGPGVSVAGGAGADTVGGGNPDPGPAAGGSATVAPGADPTTAARPGGSPRPVGGAGSAISPVGDAPRKSEPGGRTTPGSVPPVASPGGGGPAPAAPGSLSDIKIGSVGTYSGPVGEIFKAGIEAVQVWVRWVNDRGGLHGHRVRYFVADDGADPARHKALAQQMVETQGVIAFVQNNEGINGPAAAQYPTSKGIPVINTEGGVNYVYDSPMYFPVNGAGDAQYFSVIAALAEVLVPQGKHKLGVLTCVEVALCKDADAYWSQPKVYQPVGFDLAYRARASLTQPDYTTECLAARNAGVEVLLVALDNSSTGRLAASCLRQSYRPTLGIPDSVAQPNLTAISDLDGTVVGSHSFAWPATDTPALHEFHEAFEQYRPGAPIAGSHSVGWTAAKAFEAAAANLTEPPTTQAILDGLYALNGNTLGGLTYPLRFERGKPAPRNTCWAPVVLRDKQWTAPNGSKITCRTF